MSSVAEDPRRVPLWRALQAVDDVIMLLEWRYEHDVELSVAKLHALREELRLADALLESERRLH